MQIRQSKALPNRAATPKNVLAKRHNPNGTEMLWATYEKANLRVWE